MSHPLTWKGLIFLHYNLAYWLMSSVCPEFYKPQTLDGKIYPESEIKAIFIRVGKEKKLLGI